MFIEALPAHSALQAISHLGHFQTSAPLHLGRARYKDLTALGHLVDRFLEAAAWEVDQLQIGGRWPALHPVLEALGAAAEGRMVLETGGLFAVGLAVTRRGWKLQPLLLPLEHTETVLQTWHRVQPDAPRTLPPVLPMPAAGNAPLFPALLHLQPFQRDWEQPLRRSHVHVLGGMLPGAWLLDPTPLPPGAVIPELELASWEELALLQDSGRQFVISGAAGTAPVILETGASWLPFLQSALRQPDSGRQILSEVIEPAEGFIFALYEKNRSRTEYLGAVAVNDRAGKWEVSRVAV